MARLTMRLDGVKGVLQSLQQIPASMRNKGIRRALNAAGKPIVKEVKKRAPRETGLLRRSQGQKVSIPRNKDKPASLRVGPRRGFKEPIEKTKRGKLRTVPKKAQKLLPVSAMAKYRNPTRYAHLVEDGTKRGVKGQQYMKRASISSQGAATQQIAKELRAAVLQYKYRK